VEIYVCDEEILRSILLLGVNRLAALRNCGVSTDLVDRCLYSRIKLLRSIHRLLWHGLSNNDVCVGHRLRLIMLAGLLHHDRLLAKHRLSHGRTRLHRLRLVNLSVDASFSVLELVFSESFFEAVTAVRIFLHISNCSLANSVEATLVRGSWLNEQRSFIHATVLLSRLLGYSSHNTNTNDSKENNSTNHTEDNQDNKVS
jgi:hypothetical protein